MNIRNKIEEIRRQPEHIRMRYVIGSVTVTMFFISVLWIFSVITTFQKSRLTSPSAQQSEVITLDSIMPNVVDTAPSLNENIQP